MYADLKKASGRSKKTPASGVRDPPDKGSIARTAGRAGWGCFFLLLAGAFSL